MKKCSTCNQEYDDSKLFCPVCGEQLTDVTPTPTPPKSEALPWYKNWGGVLLALAGLIIAWEVNAMFGFALAILGMVFGWSSPNKINKISSLIVGAVTVMLFIWYLFA